MTGVGVGLRVAIASQIEFGCFFYSVPHRLIRPQSAPLRSLTTASVAHRWAPVWRARSAAIRLYRCHRHA